MDVDFNDFDVVYNVIRPLGDDLDHEYVPIEIKGRIVQVDLGGNEVCMAGVIEAFLVNNILSPHPLEFVCDAHSQNLFDLYEALRTEDDMLWDKGDEDDAADDFLYIGRCEILPDYRGHNLGLWSLVNVIATFGQGSSFVFLKPFPLQFEGGNQCLLGDKLKLDVFTKSEKKAYKKLKEHYAKVGFVDVPRTEYMSLNWDKRIELFEAIGSGECREWIEGILDE